MTDERRKAKAESQALFRKTKRVSQAQPCIASPPYRLALPVGSLADLDFPAATTHRLARKHKEVQVQQSARLAEFSSVCRIEFSSVQHQDGSQPIIISIDLHGTCVEIHKLQSYSYVCAVAG